MATQVKKQHVYGRFKPTPAQKLKSKKAKKKDKRHGMCEQHCENIRALPCINCGESDSEIHHLKCTGERGAGMRSTDKWGVPLCHECHINGVEKTGSRNEINWFKDRGIYCLDLASALWQNRHDLELMKNVWQTHWDKKSTIFDRKTNHPVGR